MLGGVSGNIGALRSEVPIFNLRILKSFLHCASSQELPAGGHLSVAQIESSGVPLSSGSWEPLISITSV